MINLNDMIIKNNFDEVKIFIQKTKKEKGWEWCYNSIIGDACRTAIKLGRERIVQLFLDEGVDADNLAQGDCRPLKYHAAKVGNLSIVKLLVNKGANIKDESRHWDDHDNQDAMRAAIEEGHADIVQYLLENGGNANGVFSEGLHCQGFLCRAIDNGQKLIADLLVQHGARVKSSLENDDKFRQHYANYTQAIHWCSDLEVKEKQVLIEKRDILLQRYSNSVKTKMDYAMGVDFDEMSGGLSFLEYVDIAGFNFVGVSVEGQPITQEYLLAQGLKGAAKAIVTCNDIDNIEDKERQHALKAKLEAMLKTQGKIVSQYGVVNLVPMADAAKKGLFDVVQVRLSAGVNPNQETTEILGSQFAIVAAAKNGFLNVVKLLAEHPDIDKKILVTAAHAAKKNNHLEIVNHLSLFMDVNDKDSDGEALIHKATKAKDINQIKLLLSKGADINLEDGYGRTPLAIAASHTGNIRTGKQGSEKDIILIEFLLSNGADPNKYKRDFSPLRSVVNVGCFKAVALLLPVTEKKDLQVSYYEEDENKISIPWYVPLMFNSCGLQEWPQILGLLKEHGADLNKKDRYGETILHEFIRNFPSSSNDSAIQVIECLLKYGVEVNIPGNRGNTPLHVAACKGDLAVATYLISKGADIKARSNQGLTPLHLAAAGHPQITKLLLKAGADVNALDENGRSPLAYSRKACIDDNKIYVHPSWENEKPYLEAQNELKEAGGE